MDCTRRGTGRRWRGRHAAYALLLLVLSHVSGCGGDDDPPLNPLSPTPPQVDNGAPQAAAPIPAQALPAGGGAATLDVAHYFNDPDGDSLTHAAASSDDGVVTAAVSGSVVTLTPTGAGSATVTVTATDPAGLSATQTFAVTVSGTDPQQPQGRPDLAVSQASVAASPGGTYPGGSLTLSVTVQNDGDAAASATTLRYYQSADASITPADNEVDTDPVAALAAAQSAAASADLTAPEMPGAYYYGACVDPVAAEADTADNCSAAVRVEVLDPPAQSRPDLTVTQPAASDRSPAPGDGFTLSATVQNAGDGDAPATTLRYFRSADAAIATDDTEVGTDLVAALVPSRSSSQSVDLTAPSTPGTYYYGACVDTVADEADTANNCSSAVQVTVRSQMQPPGGTPDLEVLPPSVSDSAPAAGAGFSLSATVRNAGDGPSAATTLRYFRSTDAAVTTADTEEGVDAVAGLGASGSSSQSVQLTAPSTPGAYYYGACVDPVADESDTADNCSTAVQVTVPAPPDLTVVSPSVSDTSLEAGAAFTLSATVRNDGNGAAAVTTLRYFRSTDAAVTTADTAVDTDRVESLAAGASRAESASLTAPATAGSYYYGACVDAVTDESDTANNCSTAVQVTVTAPSSAPRQTRPDLAVAAPSVSESNPAAGATFTLSVTVRNDGNGAAPATTLRYFLSTDAAVTTTDAGAGTGPVGALAASTSANQSVSLTAPSTPGTHYYGACVDAVANEADTTNNCSTAVQVTVPQPPDLTVASASVSENSPAAGATFTLSATVRNAGGGAAPATTLRYYRSDDAAITTADTAAGTDAVAGLAPAGSASGSVDLTAPSSPGDYYYGACVDAVAGEADAANNCSTAVQVTVPQPPPASTPDLVVGAPSVDDNSPTAGDTFTLSATVTNDGDGASPATTLRYYRSEDASITTADTAAGTDAVGALDADGTSDESVDLTAPAAGTYYYGACVDAVAGEADAANNCSTAVRVTVPQPPPASTPDLVVGAPSVDDNSPTAGDTFTLSATVTNDGDGASPATTLRYYRSEDASITTADTAAGTDAVGALDADGTSDESVDLTAPAAGTYYYGACVDAVAGEADAANNCSTAVRVTVPQPPPASTPDLVVGAPSVDDNSPTAGDTFTLSATVTNDGDGASPATTLRYYRSEDASITTADTAAGTDAVGALDADGTSDESVDLTAPAAGTYYYGACVDAVTGESDTTDNCSSSVQVDVEAASPSPATVVVTSTEDWAPVGNTVAFSASVLDDHGLPIAGATVSWSSSNTSVATVSTSGVVTAVSEGTAAISATAGASSSVRTLRGAAENALSAVSGSANMEVVTRASRVEVSPNSLSFDEVGETQTLTATVYDQNNRVIRPRYLIWSTADSEVVDVPWHTGAVQALGEGATTVSATANSSATGSATVSVTLPKGRVDASPRSLTFDSLGESKSVAIKVFGDDGDEDEDATFTWSVTFDLDPGNTDFRGITVTEVDGGLTIRADSNGGGSITVSSGNAEQALIVVTVVQIPSSLEVSPSSQSLSVGGTVTLSATVEDANGHSMPVAEGIQGGLAVRWSTSDPDVATVTGSSILSDNTYGGTATAKGIKSGTATITGRVYNGVIGTAAITVN